MSQRPGQSSLPAPGRAPQFDQRRTRRLAARRSRTLCDRSRRRSRAWPYGRAEAVVGADLARSADPDLCRRLSCSRGLSSAGHRPGTADAQRHAAESPYRRRALTSTADACLERRSSMNNPARNVGLLSRPSRQSLRCRFSARHHGRPLSGPVIQRGRGCVAGLNLRSAQSSLRRRHQIQGRWRPS